MGSGVNSLNPVTFGGFKQKTTSAREYSVWTNDEACDRRGFRHDSENHAIIPY